MFVFGESCRVDSTVKSQTLQRGLPEILFTPINFTNPINAKTI